MYFFWTAWASTLRSRRPLLLVNQQGLWLMLVGLVALGVSDAWLSANEQIILKYAQSTDHRLVAQSLTALRKALSKPANSLRVEEDPSISVWSLQLEVLANFERLTGSEEAQLAAEKYYQLQPGRRLLARRRRTVAVSVGGHVEVLLRLRRPWGASNPSGFNFERWFVASGYLIAQQQCCSIF